MNGITAGAGSDGLRYRRGRFAVTAILAALVLAASSSPVSASVTIGQTGTPAGLCGDGTDRLQPTVTSGNSYVVPSTIATGRITSWSTESLAGANQMLAMKVYHLVSGSTYRVEGHDGPHELVASSLNTFQASVPVKAGDILGTSTPTPGNAGCNFPVTGENYLTHVGNLADGASGDFVTGTADRRQDVSAVINPSNAFTITGVTRHKKKGTAILKVNVPNPGQLALSGNGVKTAAAHSAATVSAPGTVKLKVKAKGKKKGTLNSTGKVKVKPKITYTPTGGDPSTQSLKLKLKKKL
jgi:hypothetical protein